MIKEPIKIEDEKSEDGVPVCDKCGNVLIKESIDGIEDNFSDGSGEAKDGEWFCPHCQGEIEFLGDEDE